MNLHRISDPPYEIEDEADRLLEEWIHIDTDLSFNEYLMHHASDRVKEYMKEMSGIRDEE